MEIQGSNRSRPKRITLTIGIAALLILCGVAICWFTSMPVGVLALRRMWVLNALPATSQTAAPGLVASPTGANQATPKTDDRATMTPAVTTTLQAAPTQAATPALAPLLEPFGPTGPAGPSPTIIPARLDVWCIPWNSRAVRANVLDVIDGVTIEVDLGGERKRVRYIGIDLLDYSDDWTTWVRMTEKNQELAAGKLVLFVEGVSDSASEGEILLRYVLAEDVFINYELARSGYAIAASTPPDTVCDSAFQEAQAAAIQAERGLWAPAAAPTRTFPAPTATISSFGSLEIVDVAFRGSIWQEPEEYVEIYNMGSQPVELDGWSIGDIRNHIFIFPKFVLRSGEYCRVYTNLYRPQNCGFSFFSPSPIWDNEGDCAYLKDATGRLVDEFCY